MKDSWKLDALLTKWAQLPIKNENVSHMLLFLDLLFQSILHLWFH